MWDYIKPHLKKTTTIPDKGWVKELLPLPRVRNLRWNPDRASDWHETHPRDISCMIIQVTGDAAPQPCSKCANGKGPFAGCVVISRDAPPHVRARMVSCANCNYHNRQVDCSLIDWVVSRPQPPWPGYLGKGGQPVVRPSADSAPPMPAASPEKSRKPDRRQPALIPPGDRELTASGRAGLDASSEPRARTKTTEPARGRLVAPPAATLLRRPNAEEVVEMQDWEIAPGYIRGQTSGTQGSSRFLPRSNHHFTLVRSLTDLSHQTSQNPGHICHAAGRPKSPTPAWRSNSSSSAWGPRNHSQPWQTGSAAALSLRAG